jgi:predicted Zn-dependent peptidase
MTRFGAEMSATTAVFGLIWTALLGVQAASGQVAPSKGLDFPLTEYRLKNGLHVVLSEDDSLPVVSVVVAYGAGPVREQPGRSGLAYLMENLMFQGSENVSPMQHINYVQRIGGEFNANTAFDKTYFYETVPSNQLALLLWLESDRMASLAITGPNVERAKETLITEHRQRRTSEPYMESFFLFDSLLFPDFAYGHPVIGTEEDLKRIDEADVRAFASTYYVPNNAVLCVTGSFAVAKTRELISKYFETIRRGADVLPSPPPRAEMPANRDRIIRDTLAPSPAFHLGFRVSHLQTGEARSLRILDILLTRGKSSRLHKRLVKKERIALYLNGGVEERGGTPVLRIFAISPNDVMADLCRKAVAAEISKLRTTLVSEAELAKAKVLFKRDYLDRMARSLPRALFLCESVLSGDRLEDIPEEFERYLRVTPMMIISLANRLFKPENAISLDLRGK